MIPFWNPQGQDNVLGALMFAVDTIRMIKKVRNVLNGVLKEIGCFDGVFAILTSLMIPFWNPQYQDNILGALICVVDTIG